MACRSSAFLGAVTVATAPSGVAVTAPRRGQSLGGSWALPNGSRASTRAAAGATITSRTVTMLEPAWRFRFRGKGGGFGSLTSTPLAVGGPSTSRTRSRACSRSSGRQDGCDGHASTRRRTTGRTVPRSWVTASSRRRTRPSSRSTGRTGGGCGAGAWPTGTSSSSISHPSSIAAASTSAVGFAPGGRGAIYALDLGTGRVRWKFDTIAQPWPTAQAGAAERGACVGRRRRSRLRRHLEPRPWGGTKARPNGGAYRAPQLYTNSLVVLDGATGRLSGTTRSSRTTSATTTSTSRRSWRVPVAVSWCSAREGRSRRGVDKRRAGVSGRARWGRTSTTSGRFHAADRVCPGLFGGVLTPMALAAGRLFVPVVELCMTESGVHSASPLERPPEEGRGVLMALDAATGRRLWQRALGSAPFACATVSRDVVFVPTFDGRIHALAARTGTKPGVTALRRVSTDARRSRRHALRGRRGAAQ